MYYVYVIHSVQWKTRYVGSAKNISQRIQDHNAGKSGYTSGRRPWVLIHQEQFPTRAEAMHREKFLKSGKGRKFLDGLLT